MEVENDILSVIEQKRVIWFDYVRTANGSRWINKITNWSPIERR